MAEEKNVNLKTSTLISAVGVVAFALLGWALTELYGSIKSQQTKQWIKIGAAEKVICASHPDKCGDLK